MKKFIVQTRLAYGAGASIKFVRGTTRKYEVEATDRDAARKLIENDSSKVYGHRCGPMITKVSVVK